MDNERAYYVVGTYDRSYGSFRTLREAKNHINEMSRTHNLSNIKPAIYKRCEKPTSEYERSEIKYMVDGEWAYEYQSWEEYREAVLRPYLK